MAFDFYKAVRTRDGVGHMPFFPLPNYPTDKFERYRLGTVESRLDNIADRYYGDQRLTPLILIGNPQYKSEAEIPDGATIRIPFPSGQAVQDFERLVNEFLGT